MDFVIVPQPRRGKRWLIVEQYEIEFSPLKRGEFQGYGNARWILRGNGVISIYRPRCHTIVLKESYEK